MKSILRVLVFIIASGFSASVNAQEAQPMLGQIAPSFTLSDLNGKT